MTTQSVIEREGKRVSKYREEGKTFKQIGLLMNKSPGAVSNIYYRYAERNGLTVKKSTYKPRQKQMTNPEQDFVQVESMVIVAEGIECKVIREGERTYTVDTDYGTGVVLKKGLKLVGPLKVVNETRYGRSYTGLFNSSKRGGKR